MRVSLYAQISSQMVYQMEKSEEGQLWINLTTITLDLKKQYSLVYIKRWLVYYITINYITGTISMNQFPFSIVTIAETNSQGREKYGRSQTPQNRIIHEE